MTDSETNPDAAWKPNNRPQSTIALNFMSELNSLFNLDDDLDTLDKTVSQKKQAVSTQTQELEALQAKLREAEERLNQAKTNSPPRARDAQQPGAAQPAAIPFAQRLPQTSTDIPERPHSSQSRASVKV